MFFFACSVFFWQNMEGILEDMLNVALFPFVFFAGIIWIGGYIINLISKIESKKLYQADRLNTLYKIIFTIVVLSVVIRSFFFTFPYLSVSIEIVFFVISGIITLFTPRIIDNNNDEF